MRNSRLATTLGLCALLLAPAIDADPSRASDSGYRCENCTGGSGAFNEAPSDPLVRTADGQRQRLLNGQGGMGRIMNEAGRDTVFNLDQSYLLLVADASGQKAWVLNVAQRHPEPQASRLFYRRYY